MLFASGGRHGEVGRENCGAREGGRAEETVAEAAKYHFVCERAGWLVGWCCVDGLRFGFCIEGLII